MQPKQKAEAAAVQPKSQAPTPDQIRKRAYEIFAARGGEPGRELDDWLFAEYELNADMGRQQ